MSEKIYKKPTQDELRGIKYRYRQVLWCSHREETLREDLVEMKRQKEEHLQGIVKEVCPFKEGDTVILDPDEKSWRSRRGKKAIVEKIQAYWGMGCLDYQLVLRLINKDGQPGKATVEVRWQSDMEGLVPVDEDTRRELTQREWRNVWAKIQREVEHGEKE